MSFSTSSREPPRAAELHREVCVTAPSRLHFGLMSLDHRHGRRFGGVGLMIDAPGVSIRAHRAAEFQTTGPLAERAASFANRFFAHLGYDDPPPVAIRVERAPPDHVGLGTGTQLGLAVAAALNTLCGQPLTDVTSLAAAVGRGRRSAIGVHGFAEGGLLVEFGSLPSERLAPLKYRAAVPDTWRFVLLRPPDVRGTSGTAEERAFAELPAVSRGFTRALQDEVERQLLPSLKHADFDAFAHSIYRYGSLAGEAFAPCQDGRFATAAAARLVARIRAAGWPGVVQTSWGPTLAVATRDEDDAERLVAELRAPDSQTADLEITVARPQNRGAMISKRCEATSD